MSVRRLPGSLAALTGDGRGRLLASVAVGWFLVLGMRFVVPSVLPTITEGFGATGSQAGLAVTVLWITYAAMQFPAGYYADRLGERVLLAGGLGISAVGLVTYSFTPTFGLFVVATGVFGFGTGLYGPPRGTVVSKTYDENDGAAGPGAALRAAAGAIRNRRIALAVTGATLMLFVFQAATAFLTTYLVDIKGLTQGTAGAILGVLFVVGAVAQWTCGGLADRFGTPRVLTAVSVVSVVPLLGLPLAGTTPALVAFSALIGVRMSIGPVSNAYIIGLLPDDVQGTAWGALRTGFFLIGSFGSTLVGVMADAGLFDAAFYLLAGLTALGAVVYYFLPERT